MTIMNNSGLNAEPCNLVVKIGIQMVVLEYKETNVLYKEARQQNTMIKLITSNKKMNVHVDYVTLMDTVINNPVNMTGP